jgi:ribosome-binding protein aMBF1 (putative translation factor)
MAISKCPLCGSPCILKIVAMDDAVWCKVDVCELCLTMYPRGRTEVRVTPAKKKPRSKKAKPKKKAKKR